MGGGDLIASFLESTFNKSSFDLRDKTALKFARDGADAITIDATGSPSVVLAKKGPDWVLMPDARDHLPSSSLKILRASISGFFLLRRRRV